MSEVAVMKNDTSPITIQDTEMDTSVDKTQEISTIPVTVTNNQGTSLEQPTSFPVFPTPEGEQWATIELLVLAEAVYEQTGLGFDEISLVAEEKESPKEVATVLSSPKVSYSPPSSPGNKRSIVDWNRVSMILTARSLRVTSRSFFAPAACEGMFNTLWKEMQVWFGVVFSDHAMASIRAIEFLKKIRMQELQNGIIMSKAAIRVHRRVMHDIELVRDSLKSKSEEPLQDDSKTRVMKTVPSFTTQLLPQTTNVIATLKNNQYSVQPSAPSPLETQKHTASINNGSQLPATNSSDSTQSTVSTETHLVNNSSTASAVMVDETSAARKSIKRKQLDTTSDDNQNSNVITIDTNFSEDVPPANLPNYTHEKMKELFLMVLDSLSSVKNIEPFLEPVTEADAPKYFSIIQNPMDISTVRKNVNDGQIKTPMDLHQHLSLIFENALIYNAKTSLIHKHAKNLDFVCISIMQQFFPEWGDIFRKCQGNSNPGRPTKTKRGSSASMTPRLSGVKSTRISPDDLSPTSSVKRLKPAASIADANSRKKGRPRKDTV